MLTARGISAVRAYGRAGRRWRHGVATVAVAASVFALASVATAGPASAETGQVRDGSTSSLAAPSCWAIKQQNPASSDGVYWLQTATLIAPAQFYCDQTTDGGGWVLAGRGREGWTWSYNGQGSAAAVRNTPTGSGAFAPATLSAETVNGLLDGGRVDALDDGVRVRRAVNDTGTQWQELRIKASNRSGWTWSFGGGVLFSQISVDGVNGGSGNTQNWGTDQGFNRLITPQVVSHNYKMGFGYGTDVSGTNSSASYLWTYTTEKSALPFAQVWLRPKLTSSSYTSIPAGGLPSSTVRELASSTTSPDTPWGVNGIIGSVSELHMEVEAFAQIGSTMYVGGDFRYVQKGANPAANEKIEQSYLAGFDVNTGQWLSSFRPVLNGEVWDLQALPNGSLVVSGEFTSVNGKPNTTAIADLDPITGALKSGWSANVTQTNATSTTPAQVKAMDVQDGWLYIGGRFNRVTGGNPVYGPVTVSRLARLSVTDGRPDGTWKPNLNGSLIELDASSAGDRVYFSGYFTTVNGASSPDIGIVSTKAGAANVSGLAPWKPAIGSNANYQQAIREGSNGDVWQGGSEHVLGQYDRGTYQLKSSDITKAGGDFQTILVKGNTVYASCHCGDYTYSNDLNYGNPIPSAGDVNNIKYIGAWDATTGKYLPDFYPSALDTRSGIGGWELFPDNSGCIWFGGDFKQGSYRNGAYQWLGGFGKFCPRDTTAPSTPQQLRQTSGATTVALTWSAATDNSGSVSYEVLRGDRVIATTTDTSFTDPTPTSPSTYWVRAIDAGGNRSATSASVTAQGPDVVAPSAPTALTGSATTPASVDLSWAAATDNTAVTGYRIVRNGVLLPGVVTGLSFTDSGLSPASTYTYTVRAVDAAGNVGPDSNAVTVNTPAGDPVLFSDTWPGADSSPWSSAWTTSISSGTVTTQAGTGQLGFADVAGSYGRAQLTGLAPVTDSELLTSYTWDSTAVGTYLSVFLRSSGDWSGAYRPKNGYGVQFASNSKTVTIQKTVNGVATNLSSVANTQQLTTAKQWLRLRVSGQTIEFRTWVDGQPEPAVWSGSITDSSVTAAGQFFIAANRAGTNVGARTVRLDDLKITEA